MVMYRTPALDFSTFPESDGAPMAESIENMHEMTNLIFSFRHLLALQGRTDWAVGGNQFLYYNPLNGNDHCSPDVFVALDVPPGNRAKWETWVVGKCPDIVMEITSPSTAEIDRVDKVALYERLGAQEYYLHDPQQATAPGFVAYLRQSGRLVRAPLLPSGGIVSPLLDVELRPVGHYLRVIDPGSGAPLLVPDELWAAWLAEQAAHRQTQNRLSQTETRLQDEERARLAAEARIYEEVQARLTGEERIALLEAALRAATEKHPPSGNGSQTPGDR